MQGLAAESKGNDTFRRGLSVTYEEIGDVLAQQGNLPDALKSYRDSLAIRAALVEDTPANTGWQRDLSLSNEMAGDVLEARGNHPDALKVYRDGLDIRDRLAT